MNEPFKDYTEFNEQKAKTPFSPKPPVVKMKSDGKFIKKLPKYLLLGALVLIVFIAGTTRWYTVDDKQQAVVTTFGKVTDVTDAGFHVKLPFGIQQVEKVDVNVYQKLELGYRTMNGNANEYDIVESETKMITGDYNIVNV